MSLFWSEPGGDRLHAVRDFFGPFIETWCGLKLSRTKSYLHQNPGAGIPCTACATNAKESV